MNNNTHALIITLILIIALPLALGQNLLDPNRDSTLDGTQDPLLDPNQTDTTLTRTTNDTSTTLEPNKDSTLNDPAHNDTTLTRTTNDTSTTLNDTVHDTTQTDTTLKTNETDTTTEPNLDGTINDTTQTDTALKTNETNTTLEPTRDTTSISNDTLALNDTTQEDGTLETKNETELERLPELFPKRTLPPPPPSNTTITPLEPVTTEPLPPQEPPKEQTRVQLEPTREEQLTQEIAQSLRRQLPPSTPTAQQEVFQTKTRQRLEQETQNAKRALVILKDANLTEQGTRVGLTIKPNRGAARNVTLYENIPKEIAQNASELTFYGDARVEIIDPDPIIAWHLPIVEKETRVGYEVKQRDQEILEKVETLAASASQETRKQGFKTIFGILAILTIIALVLTIKVLESKLEV